MNTCISHYSSDEITERGMYGEITADQRGNSGFGHINAVTLRPYSLCQIITLHRVNELIECMRETSPLYAWRTWEYI